MEKSSPLEQVDLVEAIMANVPAKSLHRWACVNKGHKRWLENPRFIQMQTLNMAKREGNAIIIETSYQPHNGPKQYAEVAFLKEDDSRSVGIQRSIFQWIYENGTIMASSGGLLCCLRKNSDEWPIFICNPATGYSLAIPPPVDPYIPFGTSVFPIFHCHPDQEGYELLAATTSFNDLGVLLVEIKEYIPSSKEWKYNGKIQDTGRFLDLFNPLYFEDPGNRHIYFATNTEIDSGPDEWPYMVRYDLETQQTVRIECPPDIPGWELMEAQLNLSKYRNPQTGKWSLCLTHFIAGRFQIWTWNNEWRRLSSYRLEPTYMHLPAFNVINGETLVVGLRDAVYSYSLHEEDPPNTRRIQSARKIPPLGIHPYVSTLRSCGEGAQKIPRAIKYPDWRRGIFKRKK